MACRPKWSSGVRTPLQPLGCRRSSWLRSSCWWLSLLLFCGAACALASAPRLTWTWFCRPEPKPVYMDPDDATAATLTTVNNVAVWAGLGGTVGDRTTARGALFHLLGLAGTEHPRIVGILPAADITAAIARWQLRTAGGTDEAPTMTQLGQAGVFARTCRYVCGVPEVNAGTTQPAIGPQPAAPTTNNGRKVKMSHVINQADEEEIDMMTAQEVTEAYDRYVKKTGGFPPEDEELSAEQISTLSALYQSGRAPYTDFAVWGPYQHRIQKKMKLKGMKFNSAGELVPIEMYGPADFESWRECYQVFRTGSIMFDQISPAKLDRYEKLIRQYHERYGRACWPIIYQADVRARLEESERVRRQGREAFETAQKAGLTHPFDPAKPWDWVWGTLTMQVLGFWQKEIVEPCMLYLAKTANLQHLVDDDAPTTRGPASSTPTVTTSVRSMPSAPSAPSESRPPKRQRGPDVREHRVGDDGQFTHNRRGVELCRLFQTGECMEKDGRGNCARNSSRRHQCAKCLSENHGANKCGAEGLKPPRANHGKGRGKGRGRKWLLGQQSMHENSGTQMKEPEPLTGVPDESTEEWNGCANATGVQLDEANEGKCVLHLFSGPENRVDGFAAYVRAKGWTCDEYDIVNGPHQDLTSDHVWQEVMQNIHKGKYQSILILAGPPCNTFSNARKAGEAGPQPLRGACVPERYGLKDLRMEDKEKVKTGTLLACRAAEAATAMSQQKKPSVLEQPKWTDDGVHVSMYNLDEFEPMKSNPDFEFRDLVQCEYGAPTMKPTTLMLGCLDQADLHERCTHDKRWWKRPTTGECHYGAHPPLKGKEWYIKEEDWKPSMKKTWWEIAEHERKLPYLTSAAQAYPAELNRKLADMLTSCSSRKPEAKPLERAGRWGNVLKRKRTAVEETSTTSRFVFETPLRGQRKQTEDDEEPCWGGMRKPVKISKMRPAYRRAGHQLWLTMVDYLQTHPEVQDKCLQAIGSEAEDAGPTMQELDEMACALQKFSNAPHEEDKPGMHTLLRAGLIRRLAHYFEDPDAELMYQWLTEGAPAGISMEIEDPGQIFPKSDEYEPEEMDQLPDPHSHVNYGSVELDEAAEPEIQRLIATGFVRSYDNYEQFERWLGSRPHLSKLGMITKEKEGRIKRRLILDCKESGVNKKAKKGGKLVLPRISDAVEDALYLMNKTEKNQQAEWLILDFSDWFFNIPLHPAERKHFTLSYKGTYVGYLVQAQGSVNAPVVCGRVAALLARMTQAMLSPSWMRLQLYVDDPILCMRGGKPDRDRMMAAVILLWATLGVRLAYKKASRGSSVQWIGATMTMHDQASEKARLVVRAKPEIVQEVKVMTHEHDVQNVCSKKSLQTYVGKLNHIAGIVPVIRPFLSDVYGVIHQTADSHAPSNCYWTKQWRYVTVWMREFLANEGEELYREYRLQAYYGNGIQMQLVTDASPWGIGGYLVVSGTILTYFASKLTERDVRILNIQIGDSSAKQIAEALSVLVGLKLWSRLWQRPQVQLQIKSDNVGTLTLLKKLRTNYKSPNLGLIVREMALLFGRSSYQPRLLSHIPGLSNTIADCLSRLFQPNGGKQMPSELTTCRRTTAPVRDEAYYKTYLPLRKTNIRGT